MNVKSTNRSSMRAVLLPMLLLLFGLQSCRDNEVRPAPKGKFQINVSKPAAANGRTTGELQPSSVVLSIEDANGNSVLSLHPLSVYGIGDGYVSESLELETGNYRLTQFIVRDADGKSIYIAPIEGSEPASLVNDPLPITFSVTENGVSEVTVEVLEIQSTDTPDTFGYASFNFNIVRPVHDIQLNIRGFARFSNFQKTSVAFTVKVKGYKYDDEYNVTEVWSSDVAVPFSGTTIVLKDTLDGFSYEVTGSSTFEDVPLVFVDKYEIQNFSLDQVFFLTHKSYRLLSLKADIMSGAGYSRHANYFSYTNGVFGGGSRSILHAGSVFYSEAFDYEVSYSQGIPHDIYYDFTTGNTTWMNLESTSNPSLEYPTQFLLKSGNSLAVFSTKTLSLTWENERITGAHLYENASKNFYHTYAYDEFGNLTAATIKDAAGNTRYTLSFQYTSAKNLMPAHAYHNFVLENFAYSHDDLMLVPFMLGGPLQNLNVAELTVYESGVPHLRERATYLYEFDPNQFPKPTWMNVDLEVTNLTSGATTTYNQRMKNFAFTFSY